VQAHRFGQVRTAPSTRERAIVPKRALAMIWEAGAQPVVLLTKLDTCDDAQPMLEQARAVAIGTPVHAVSARTGDGLDALDPYLAPGKTVVLIGSSGVGTSTLVNSVQRCACECAFPVRKRSKAKAQERDAHWFAYDKM
jgi:ribosome biogenesis GTPase